jgi:hypothetical protein
MMSLMMISLWCHIFAPAQSHHIGRTLHVPLPRFRYTVKQVGTWQYILDLETEQGDLSGENQLLSISNQDCEGVGDNAVHSNCYNQRVSFADQPGIDEEINNPTAASDNSKNQWHMPTPINLDSSGLCCSSRTEVLSRCGLVYFNTTLMDGDKVLTSPRGLVYSNTTLMDRDKGLTSPQTAHLRLASQQSFKSALVLFSTICSFGYGVSRMAHSLQEKATVTSTSTFPNAIDSYHRVNTLYDGMINCLFSMLAQSSITSNETFSYNQALKQDNFCEFIKAMMIEVSDHESREHWTLSKWCDMPEDMKTIMSIWSFKCKWHPDGTLNKNEAQLCAQGGMQTWGQNYWET